jgi:hypothetical protein
VLIFQTVFLLLNQKNWNRASEYAVKIINGIRANKQRPLYLVNLPSDHKGAYVFRNCLLEALLINNIDTTGIRVVNVVQSTEFEKRRLTIVPEKQAENIFIWPNTLLEVKNGKVVRMNGDSTANVSIELSAMLYWLYILADYVKFQVHDSVYFYVFHVCVVGSVGDNSNRKLILSDIEAGEADTVYANRSFFNYER